MHDGVHTREQKLDEPIWSIFRDRLEESLKTGFAANAQSANGARRASRILEV
jgi:hypothetical protein